MKKILIVLFLLIFTPILADSIVSKVPNACFIVYDKVARIKDRMLLRGKEGADVLSQVRLEQWEEFKEKTKKYWSEVYQSKYFNRILLRDPNPDGPNRLLLSALTEYQPNETSRIGRIIQLANPFHWIQAPVRFLTKRYGKNYTKGLPHEITPFKLLYHTFLRIPVGAATKKIAGKKKEFTNWFDIPLSFGVGWVLYDIFDDRFEKAREKKMLAEIEANAPKYDRLIDEDPRFSEIKYDLTHPDPKGKVPTKKQARIAAYKLLQAHNAYAEYLAEEGKTDSPEDKLEKRLAFYRILAPHVVKLIERGVVPLKGFMVPEESLGPLTSEQIVALLDNHDLYFSMVAGRKQLVEMAKDLKGEKLPKDFFQRDIIEMYQEGTFSKKQLTSAMMEDAQWAERLSTSEILQIVPLTDEGLPDTLLEHRIKIVENIAFENEERKKKKLEKRGS